MECDGDDNAKVVDSFIDDITAGSALNASILNYYKKFGRKRDLEQYFSLSTAQSEIRDPSSLFWRKMKSQSDSDSGEKKSDSSTEICRISIKCLVPDTEPSSSQDDKEKEESQSPPIITEEVIDTSKNLDISVRSDEDDRSQKSMDATLDISTNKPFSPTSSITSQRKLEWDSLADVGYGNETDRKASGSSLSTIERLALNQQYSNNDSQQDNIGVPTAHSTPQDDNDIKSKVKGKTTKFYNRDVEHVQVNIPHSSNTNPSQAINVNLTKHISFNVDQGGSVTKDVTVEPNKVSVETEITPQIKFDKQIQTSLTKSRDKSSSSGDLTNNASTYGKVLINLNSLRKRHRRKKLKNLHRMFRSKRRVKAEKENIPIQEKSGEQVSEAESFEYMPGHIYNQNQMKDMSRPSNAAGNKSSLESSGVLTTDSSKTSKASFKQDLEKSVSLLKMALQHHDDSSLKQKLIKEIVQRLIKSTYRGDESSTEFLSGLSFTNKLLGLSESNHTTTSTSDANNTTEKVTKPKKSILRNDKFNSSAIASTSQSAPNLPSVSNSEKPVTTNLKKQLLSSNTDSDISSKEKTSSDNALPKTSSEELYQKYINALRREESYKKHLRDKEMFLKQKLVSSDTMLKLPANLDAKSQSRLKDMIKDLTRNNYDDGSGDASKLEGGSNGTFERFSSGRKQRSHSVFTLSSGTSDYQNRKGSRNNDSGGTSKPGPSQAGQWSAPSGANPRMRITDSAIQVNMDPKIAPFRSNDFKESRSSQTNVNLGIGQSDNSSLSAGSSKIASSCGRKPNTNNNKIFVHEATRSIQTEISIDPKISDPSLHDIVIRGEDDGVSLISEHYRQKSRSTIPTTNEQGNVDAYPRSVLSGSANTGSNDFRLGSSVPSEAEQNPDNFAIPIQGTNMTLMVSLNSNPVKIPPLHIATGTETEKPGNSEKGTSLLVENSKGVQSNVPLNSCLKKPLVNTLFTRQNFLNEIYPNNAQFDNPAVLDTPKPKKNRKICNDGICHKLNPQLSRETSTDTSDNENNSIPKTCSVKTCKNKPTCSRETCDDFPRVQDDYPLLGDGWKPSGYYPPVGASFKPSGDHQLAGASWNPPVGASWNPPLGASWEPSTPEPVKVDMGTNTDTQSTPIEAGMPKPLLRSCRPAAPESPKKLCIGCQSSTCKCDGTHCAPPKIEKSNVGCGTERPKPLQRSFEPPEPRSPKKFSAATGTDSPRYVLRTYEHPEEPSPKKSNVGTCTESPRKPVLQTFDSEPPVYPTTSCAGTGTESLTKPVQRSDPPALSSPKKFCIGCQSSTCDCDGTRCAPPKKPKYCVGCQSSTCRCDGTLCAPPKIELSVGCQRSEEPTEKPRSTCVYDGRPPYASPRVKKYCAGCQSSTCKCDGELCAPRVKKYCEGCRSSTCKCNGELCASKKYCARCQSSTCKCDGEVCSSARVKKYCEGCRSSTCKCDGEVCSSPRFKKYCAGCQSSTCKCDGEVCASPRIKKYCERCQSSICKCDGDTFTPPRIKQNEDCNCPAPSKCKDIPCKCSKDKGYQKEVLVIPKGNTYPREIKITTRNLCVGPNTLPSDCGAPKSVEIKCPRLQFKDYINRLQKYDVPESCTQDSRYQSCDTDNTDCGTSKDLILDMIQDITNRYSKKDIAKSQRKKCFKEIMTILNYLLDTDESPDPEQLKMLMSTTTQEETEVEKEVVCSCCRKKKELGTKSETSTSKCTECGCRMTSEKEVSGSDIKEPTKVFCRQDVEYATNVDADCVCGALFKVNEVCTCKKKECVDKGVQLSNRKSKTRDVKHTESSDIPVSSDLPCTSSDSATCKVLNKIRKECERYHQKRCMSHHNCKKCEASSSTSVNCDCCKRVHHCSCRTHKCKNHRHKAIEKLKKKCLAYNLIIQTSESMISEEPNKNNCRPLQNVVVKVPPQRHCVNMPFKELANRIEERIPCNPRIHCRSPRSRSLPNDSFSSLDENMQKVHAFSVRQYLERNRPDFVEHCSRRQTCLKMMTESRNQDPCASAGQMNTYCVPSDMDCNWPMFCNGANIFLPYDSCVDPYMRNCRNQVRRIASEHATKDKLLSMQLQMDTSPLMDLSEADLRRLAKELGIDSRHKKVPPKFISERDMKKHSERIYKSLPEVVRKKDAAKKENMKRANLLMANIFKKNLQKKTLKGAVNLSNYSNVVKI